MPHTGYTWEAFGTAMTDVAAMGMERIDFLWYLRKISWLAVIGFLAGAAAFLVLFPLLH